MSQSMFGTMLGCRCEAVVRMRVGGQNVARSLVNAARVLTSVFPNMGCVVRFLLLVTQSVIGLHGLRSLHVFFFAEQCMSSCHS